MISQRLSDLPSCPSYCPVLHKFVQSFADLGEVGSEGAAGVVQFGQELRVGEMVEDVVDAAVGFRGEVGVDQLQQQIPAAGQKFGHHSFIEGEVHLIEADRCHGPLVQLLLKIRGHSQLLRAKTVVPEQHADLDGDLDQVFDHLLGFTFITRVLFGDAVQFVQDLAGGVVDEHLDRALAGHGAEDLLLHLHGHVLGAEDVHGCLCVC